MNFLVFYSKIRLQPLLVAGRGRLKLSLATGGGGRVG